MRRQLIAVALVLFSVLGVTLVAAAPAQAVRATFEDRRGDVADRNDILSTTVRNDGRIGVVVQHRDLTERALDIQFQIRTASDSSWSVYATLDGSVALVYQGTTVVECPGVSVSRSLRSDVSKLSVPRSCVGDPQGRIAVRPRVQWNSDGSQGDWSINRGTHFTPFVKR